MRLITERSSGARTVGGAPPVTGLLSPRGPGLQALSCSFASWPWFRRALWRAARLCVSGGRDGHAHLAVVHLPRQTFVRTDIRPDTQPHLPCGGTAESGSWMSSADLSAAQPQVW